MVHWHIVSSWLEQQVSPEFGTFQDDDSDSDWSEGSISPPAVNSALLDKQRHLPLTSDEEDEVDGDLFGPSSKATQRVSLRHFNLFIILIDETLGHLQV